MPKTKIIATLGPASSDYTTLRKMFAAGLDVVRLNFSHGTHKEHLQRIEIVRKLNQKYRRAIKIMADLEGFRIRIGHFKGKKSIDLKKRQTLWLTNDPAKTGEKVIPFDYNGDLRKVKKGQHIFIDDGNIILKAKESSMRSIKAEVIEGGELKERKGVNMPGVKLEFKAMTEKDKLDIALAIEQRVDYVSLSFVRDAKDVKEAAELIKPKLAKCKIVAKIESREAIGNIDKIIEVSDGIMVARGDMGIAVPIYEIPMIQKRIIRKCNSAKKFVITATQMLEHMTEHSRPTRAEVTDVANAIIDGTNFVMLSAETAAGKFPCESVIMMNEIIKYTEKEMSNITRL
ncbi:MAG: pyruvate kinase [Phycisphaerae bacterium]|nr:pyruvate kinase [Phycisphaerae bacterium]